ncbi:MAG: right-handed parallel beta-helix repeat-containing protein [Opitutae bacterium]|nr:right-handed parallel beta-helix repeat-containing protein [Opitutae bacterium]
MAASNATILKKEKLKETISPTMLTLKIEGNYIAHNAYSPGIWFDNEFPGSRISRNVIHHNGTHGIFLEMSNYGFDQLLVDRNLIFENQMDAIYIHDASGATFSHNLISDSSSPSSGGQLVRIQQVSHRASTANHSFFHNLFVGRLAKIETNYPAFLSGLQRFDFNGYGFHKEDRKFLISNKSDVPYPWKEDTFRELILKELGSRKTPTAWMKLKNKVSMDIDEWKKFWQNKDQKNDLNSFFSPDCKIRYDELKQEITILNFRQVSPKGISSSPYNMEQDFFGKNLTNKQGKQCGPFAFGKDKQETYEIWSGLEILKPHSLPAKDWNR